MKKLGLVLIAPALFLGLIGLSPVAAGQLAAADGLKAAGADHPFAGKARLSSLLRAGYTPFAQIEGAGGGTAFLYTVGVPYPTVVMDGDIFELDIDAFDKAFPVVKDLGPVNTGYVCQVQEMCRATGKCVSFTRWCVPKDG